MANRTDATFVRVIGSELVQKYVGEGARMVREIFEMARSKKAAVIFFDEVDAIGGQGVDAWLWCNASLSTPCMQSLARTHTHTHPFAPTPAPACNLLRARTHTSFCTHTCTCMQSLARTHIHILLHPHLHLYALVLTPGGPWHRCASGRGCGW